MRQSPTSVLGAALLLLLSACSKTSPSAERSESDTTAVASASVASTPSEAVVRTAFKNVESFKGKPPLDLVKDDEIGKEIRAVVPQSQFKCMDDIFNYMRDLEIDGTGAVTANMNGSHADRFMEAFISVTPGGVVNVVLQCDPQRDPKGKYQFFTNEGIRSATPKAILDWMYAVGRDGDTITKSDGKVQIDISYATFVESLLAGAARNSPATAAVSSSTTSATTVPSGGTVSAANLAGSWTCQTTVPNGSVILNSYEFQAQGSFSSIDQNTLMTGIYEVSGATVSLQVLGVTQAGTTLASNAIVDLQVDALTGQELRFNSVIRKSGTKRTSACVKAIPQATAQAKAQAPARSAGNGQRGKYIPAGSVICLSVRSFNKVNAIEMTRNQLASLPDDCDHIGTDSQVNVLKTISDPVVGMVHLVGNAGGTGYVRMRDLR